MSKGQSPNLDALETQEQELQATCSLETHEQEL